MHHMHALSLGALVFLLSSCGRDGESPNVPSSQKESVSTQRESDNVRFGLSISGLREEPTGELTGTLHLTNMSDAPVMVRLEPKGICYTVEPSLEGFEKSYKPLMQAHDLFAGRGDFLVTTWAQRYVILDANPRPYLVVSGSYQEKVLLAEAANYVRLKEFSREMGEPFKANIEVVFLILESSPPISGANAKPIRDGQWRSVSVECTVSIPPQETQPTREEN